MDQVSCKLTIFEGSDGSGKSTAAQAYAELTNARYVHFPALPQVGKNLARMYVEAMLPALLGYQDVVFDRCWLSELPYVTAFREGSDRLGEASCRMLERLAMRCGAVVVRCQPPWEVVRETYLGRRQMEMLKTTEQLKMVYDLYNVHQTGLPELVYDYTQETSLKPILVESLRMPQHPLNLMSAGNWVADVVLIGETFAERKDSDSFYQWPFASFNGIGCSQWLTTKLNENNVDESQLLWMNADQDLSILYDLKPEKVIALGNTAYSQLYELKIMAASVPHPQHQKRFNQDKAYELFNYI